MLKYFLCRIRLLMVGKEKEVAAQDGKATTSERAFGQRDYVALFGNVLRATSTGKYYKYTILLPIREYYEGAEGNAKTVFTKKDVKQLRRLLRGDFGGVTFSYSTGDWIDDDGRNVVNDHAQYEVSGQKNSMVRKYFAELKARLLLHADEVRNIPQNDIYVQRSAVNLGDDVFEKPPLEELSGRLTKLKEKLNNLKR